MTTEELIAASTGPARAQLEAALIACDLVRFGRAESTASGRERVLAAAEGIVNDGGGPAGRFRLKACEFLKPADVVRLQPVERSVSYEDWDCAGREDRRLAGLSREQRPSRRGV